MNEENINFNRLSNTHNPYQGGMKKVLCLCSAGLLRSPTLAFVLSNPPYNFNTRAAGVEKEYALIHVDLALIEWADEIVCAELEHTDYAKELLTNINITNQKKPVYNLDIPDNFRTRDPKLIEIIKGKLKDIYKG